MKGAGMLVGNFELNPLRRPILVWPKLLLTQETILKHRQVYSFIFLRVQP